MATTQDSGVREEAKKRIDEARARYKAAMGSLEKLEQNDEGKRLLSELTEAVKSGKETNNQVITLAMSGNTGEASRKYGEVTKLVSRYIEAADKIVKYDEGQMQSRFEEAERRPFHRTDRLRGARRVGPCLRRVVLPDHHLEHHHPHGPLCRPHRPHGQRRFLRARLSPCPHEEGRDRHFCEVHGRDDSNLGRMLRKVASSAANVASASTQSRPISGKISQEGNEQVERATQVAAASTQMSQASEDIAKNSTRAGRFSE